MIHKLVIIALLILPHAAYGQAKGWEKEWTDTLEGAKKEGKLVVATSPDPVMREIAAKFKARYGITVEHLAGSSTKLADRLGIERRSGVNTVDVFLGGVQSVANTLYPEKMLDPLKPALILPEVVEAKKWKGGKPWFIDPEERYVLRVYSTITSLLSINTDHVKPGDLVKAADLLQAKWHGKIATEDPTVAGSGSNTAARIYVQMGEEYVKKLYLGQKVVITRERRQLTDWLARGTHPIVFGAQSSDVEKMTKEGFPLKDVYGFYGYAPGFNRLAVAVGADEQSATSECGAGVCELDRLKGRLRDLCPRGGPSRVANGYRRVVHLGGGKAKRWDQIFRHLRLAVYRNGKRKNPAAD